MDQEKIGKFIKDLRVSNNLTQSDFADSLGVTYQAVSKWENGKNIPDISILKQISKIYNVEIDELLDGKKKQKNKNTWYKYVIIILLILIIIGLFIFLKNKNSDNFYFKQVKSTCSEYKITGIAAYDTNRSSLYITGVEYCEEDDLVYNNLACTLYEEYGDMTIKIAECKSGVNTTLKDYLKTVEIKVDDYKQVCSKFSDVKMYLEINAKTNDKLEYEHKIPLKIDDEC